MRRPRVSGGCCVGQVPASAATRVTASMSGKPNTFRARERARASARNTPSTLSAADLPLGARRPPARRCRRCRGSRSCRRGTRRRRPRSPRCRQLGRCRRPLRPGGPGGRPGRPRRRAGEVPGLRLRPVARHVDVREPLGPGQAEGDRHEHPRPHLRDGGAVVELHHRVDHLLRVHHDVDALEGDRRAGGPRSPRAPCSPALRSWS